MNIFKKIAGAGELSDYAPSPQQGEHVFALAKFGFKETREYGDMIEAEFLVVESTSERPGSFVGDAWFISKPGLDGQYSQKRVLAFAKQVCVALGQEPDEVLRDPQSGAAIVDTDGQPVTRVQKVLSDLCDKSQPGTGIMIRASAKKRTTKKEREVVNITYTAVANTAELINANRGKIEQSRPKANAQSVQQTAQNWTPPAQQSAPVMQTTQSAPAQTAPAPIGGGLLGGLLGR